MYCIGKRTFQRDRETIVVFLVSKNAINVFNLFSNSWEEVAIFKNLYFKLKALLLISTNTAT
jgi:hypothetical protein